MLLLGADWTMPPFDEEYKSSKVGAGADCPEMDSIPRFDVGGGADAKLPSEFERLLAEKSVGAGAGLAMAMGKPPIPCGPTVPGGWANRSVESALLIPPPKGGGGDPGPASIWSPATPPGRVESNSGLTVAKSLRRGWGDRPLALATDFKVRTTASSADKTLASSFANV